MSSSTEKNPVLIYILKDPRNEEVRYVGKTSRGLNKRFGQHMRDKKKNHRCNWIQSLKKEGLKPILELIETVVADGDWAEREKYWIEYYRKLSVNLTNQTDGGEGVVGRVVSEETREKIRQSNLGIKSSPEAREKMRQFRLGKNLTEEQKRKLYQNNMKPIDQFALDENFNEIFVRNFESIVDATIKTGISRGAIKHNLDGKTKSIKNFVFRFCKK